LINVAAEGYASRDSAIISGLRICTGRFVREHRRGLPRPDVCHQSEYTFRWSELTSVARTAQMGHGRTETRIVDAVSLPRDFAPREDWKDLKTLVVVTSQRVVGGQESWESRYYITDHRPVRSSWGVRSASTGGS
jgi:hypothetical protein